MTYTYEQTDNIVRKMMERFDCSVHELLRDLSPEVIEELKADPPHWVEVMKIDLDFILSFRD